MVFAKKLYNSAKMYRNWGFSVIPVQGEANSANFKASAVSWARFQRDPPTLQQITNWFLVQQFGGLAIVCGRVSALAVLDFDDAELAMAFQTAFPNLAQTRVVRSGRRGLPHFYFRVPPGLRTRSRSAPGVDWQYEGRYVIAPPTQVGDYQWQVERDTALRTLSSEDLAQIEAFLDSVGSTPQKLREASMHPAVVSRSISSQLPELQLTVPTVVGFYRARIRQLGSRNRALFETACWVRDRGGNTDVLTPLIAVHAQEPAIDTHTPETPEKRRREALKTIASAFSRPARERRKAHRTNLPTSLREALLKLKQTATLRLLETLYAIGWHTGKTFTRSVALAKGLAAGIGEWSVRKALKALLPDGEAVFSPATPASDTDCEQSYLNAFEIGVTKPPKNKRGRPATLYTLPDPATLCARLNVEITPGDTLDPEDLGSARAYRQAVHRELIRRRPGQYFRGWLAARLGVSIRTMARYRSVTIVLPTYTQQPVYWSNMKQVIPPTVDFTPPGAFLSDENGKRYPARRPIAQRLLAKRKRLTYCVQGANEYLPHVPNVARCNNSTAEAPPNVARCNNSTTEAPPNVARCNISAELSPTQATTAQAVYEAIPGLARDRARELTAAYGAFAVQSVANEIVARKDVVNSAGLLVQMLDARFGRGDESLAEDLFLTVRQMNPASALSWDRCRDLVTTHGVDAVMGVLQDLQRASESIRNPAGYVIRALERGVAGQQVDEVLVGKAVELTTRINPDNALDRNTVVDLLRKYGANALSAALGVLERRSGVNSPAGFVVAYMRSQGR